jgi:integrative and conjugative element protein (TIGR02256 family)
MNSIEIAPGARADILRLASESRDGRETGGILLGHGPDLDGLVQVELAGDPGPNAQRHSDFFLRDLDHARALAEKAWSTSRAVWIGEWHTHPRGGHAPSSSDLRTYMTLLSIAELEFELFTAVIVTAGSEKDWSNPRLWSWLLRLE